MSRKMLESLNGNHNGLLKRFLDEKKGEPRIAWYPSARDDFHPLLFLHPRFLNAHIPSEPLPQPPEIFLFTDMLFPTVPCYYEWLYDDEGHNKFIFQDNRTAIMAYQSEGLTNLEMTLDANLLASPGMLQKHRHTNSVYCMEIKVLSDTLGYFNYLVIYAVTLNQTFFKEVMMPNQAKISHIYHCNWGGEGGKGAWMPHILRLLECELYIKERYNQMPWSKEDSHTLNYCKDIPREMDKDIQLIPVTIHHKNRNYFLNDLVWNKVEYKNG